MGEDANPDLSTALDAMAHGTAGGLDLPGGNFAWGQRLEAEHPKTDRSTGVRGADQATARAVGFPEFGSSGL